MSSLCMKNQSHLKYYYKTNTRLWVKKRHVHEHTHTHSLDGHLRLKVLYESHIKPKALKEERLQISGWYIHNVSVL